MLSDPQRAIEKEVGESGAGARASIEPDGHRSLFVYSGVDPEEEVRGSSQCSGHVSRQRSRVAARPGIGIAEARQFLDVEWG